MAEFGSTENILWFYAVLFFTVAPVLRFRENFLVPSLATLLVFGFYSQSYWRPDFYALEDWPRIIMSCAAILVFYFISGFFVHFLWFRGKSQRLREHGAFAPLFKAWISGKTYVVADEFVAEIRRLRMFEVVWTDIASAKIDGDEIVISDNIEREPEILSEVRISEQNADYTAVKEKLEQMGKL